MPAAAKPPSKTPQHLGWELLAECAKEKPSLPHVQALLAAGATLDEESGNAMTPLIWAAYNQQDAICQALLEAGAATDDRSDYGRTALMFAAMSGNEAIAKALLGRGAAVDLKDHNGDTALHLAADESRIGVLRLLLAAGADMDIRGGDNDTVLDYARKFNMPLLTGVLEEEEARRANLRLEKEREDAELQALLKNPVTARDVVVRPVTFKRKR